MLSRGLGSLLFGLATCFTLASAQLVTVTVHNSVCPATYSTNSVTVVQSTVTVAPTPFTDVQANSGTPFVLRVQQGAISGSTKRPVQQHSWLTLNGNTTVNASLAAQYHILNGQLSSLNGSYASTKAGIPNQPFALFEAIGPISTTFAVQNGALYWNNTNFSNGTAQFYEVPAGLLANAQIAARFSGAVQPTWGLVTLYADPRESERHIRLEQS